MMIWIFALGALWLGCAILAHGLTLAYFQRKWPTFAAHHYRNDFIWSVRLALLGGPVALIVSYLSSERGKYGLKFR